MTIGFNALGRMGRLCNQMFQYAALKGIARNTGVDCCIPHYTQAVDDGIGNMLRTELFDSFDLDVNKFMKLFNWLKKLWEKIREVDSIIRQINR